MNNYEAVTKFIIDKLKEGVIPWRSPWRGHNLRNMNYTTKKPYHGINALMTSMMGYKSPYWMTFNQIKKVEGAKLIKGTKGVPILFATYVDYVDSNGNDQTKVIVKRSHVFNLERIEGIDCPVMAKADPTILDFKPIEECEKLIQRISPNLCPVYHIEEYRAYYSVLADSIHISRKPLFRTEQDYYATLFHEIIHSTGSKKKCDRDLTGGKRSSKYAKEELIAEIGSQFLCHETGIEKEQIENSAAYIKSWIRVLEDSSSLIIQASHKAEEAINYLNNGKK